jgi:hypothetical protein
MNKEGTPFTNPTAEPLDLDLDSILSSDPLKDPVGNAEAFLLRYRDYRVTHAIGMFPEGEGLHPLDLAMRYLSKVATATTKQREDETLLEVNIRRGDKLKPWQEAERNLRQRGVS